MECRHVSIDGISAIVCGPRRRRPKCTFCDRRAPLLCDQPMKDGKTCDKPLCSACAVKEGSLDLCPTHKGSLL